MKLGIVLVLSIVHVAHGCHVWATADGRPLGASRTIQVSQGGRIAIRISCPMDFDVVQTAGPKLALGDPRWHTGTSHVLVFAKKGVYRLRATNVQSPEEVGLQVLGAAQVDRLVVRVG